MTQLCPETLCGYDRPPPLGARLASLSRDTAIVLEHLLLPERFTGRLPPIDSQWGSFDPAAPTEESGGPLATSLLSEDRLKNFELFIEGLGSRESRNLSFLHLGLPHGPFLYLSSGKTYLQKGKKYIAIRNVVGRGRGKADSASWGPNRYLVDLAYQRLTHHIMLADKLVGRLLDRLEETNMLERSLIVVAADHGHSYEPNIFPRMLRHADTLHVPLFIKFPQRGANRGGQGRRQGVVDDHVQASPTGRIRVESYLEGLRDPLESSYHVRRSLEAFVKGGWVGVGIGKADTKLTGLPVPPTDSIYAVIGEEMGVVGAVFVLALYGGLLWRGLEIAQRAPDLLGSLLAAGLTIWIVLEAFINMAVIVGLLPFAGNALPFISAGGSSLVVSLIAMGIVLNISRRSYQESRKTSNKIGQIVNYGQRKIYAQEAPLESEPRRTRSGNTQPLRISEPMAKGKPSRRKSASRRRS